MNGFIDIHTHILPGVDDGAQNETEALDLVRIGYENGTRAFILTPHYRGNYHNTTSHIMPIYKAFKEKVLSMYPDIQICLGCEIHYDAEVPEMLYSKKLRAMNHTKCALIELSNNYNKLMIKNAVNEVVRHGFIPIIAHVEHVDILRKSKELINELIKNGAYIQINVDSLLGKNGLIKKFYCNKLLKQHKVHFVASDTHNKDKRPPILSDGYDKVLKKFGEDYANQIFIKNQQELLGVKAI